MDDEEHWQELQRLKNWYDYYYERWKQTDKIKYWQKSVALGEQVKIKLRNSPVIVCDRFYEKYPDRKPEELKSTDTIETGTRKVNREIARPKSFLKPVIDEIMRDIKIGKATFKADIKMSIDTGQLKRSITGKKDD